MLMVDEPRAERVATATPDLARAAARGAASTTVARAVRVVVQAAAVVLLARLLTPEDYGLVAVVATIAGVAELLRDFGLSNAAVQAPRLSTAERTNLHWLNVALGAVLAVLLAALAGPVAALFGHDEIVGIVRWLALTMLVNSWATQYRASLARDLRFTALATLEVGAMVAGTLVAVVLAWRGAGYWALVAMQVTTAVLMAVGSTVQGRWWPGRYRRDVRVRGFLRFGSHVFVTQLLGYASRNVDTFVAGLRFGVVATGLYNRAFQLMSLPITQLSYPASKVALPVLARLQDDDRRFERYLLRGQTVLLHALLPVVAVACAMPGPVVAVVLGPAWQDAAPLLQVLALGGMFEAASFSTSWVLQATGATGLLLRYSLVVKPFMIACVVVGSLFGLEGIAAGYAVAAVVAWPAGLLWVRHARRSTARGLFAGAAVAISGHLGLAAVVWLVARLMAGADAWVVLLTGLLVLAAGGAVLALVWPAWRRGLAAVLATARLGISRRSTSGAEPRG